MLNFQNERIPQNKTVNIAQDLESIRKIRWVVCVCVNLKIMRGLILKSMCLIYINIHVLSIIYTILFTLLTLKS